MSASKTAKLDLRGQLKPFYSPSQKEVEVVTVPRLRFIMTEGMGDPRSATFHDAIQTLYTLSYTLKFDFKMNRGTDLPVMALEGLWWTGRKEAEFDMMDREHWKWILMIMQTDLISAKDVEGAASIAAKKGKHLTDFRFEDFEEGLSAQIMHIGPYSKELPTIQKLRTFMKANNYVPNGKHHEIYLGDPRRAAPSKLRTILRQPIK